MVRKGFNPGSGQGIMVLPEAQPPVDLKERAATGRLMGSRAVSYFGIELETLGQVVEADLEHVSIDSLRGGLYERTGGLRISNMAVNETEYTLVVRNPEAFTVAVEAQTARARQLDNNVDRREAAGDRSIDHAVEVKVETFEGLMKWLKAEEKWLTLLQREMRTPGFSHMDDASLRILAGEFWQFSLGNILAVVAKQRRWSSEELEAAKRAMVYQMTHGQQKDRVTYVRELVDMAEQYNHNRQILFASKMRQAAQKGAQAKDRAEKRFQ